MILPFCLDGKGKLTRKVPSLKEGSNKDLAHFYAFISYLTTWFSLQTEAQTQAYV